MPRRLYIPNMKDVLKDQHNLQPSRLSDHVHDSKHSPKTVVYQTAETLDTVEGPGLRLPRGGEITRISGRVAGAPSGGVMKIDVLAGGVSIFESSSFLQIPDGEKVTKEKIVERSMFNEDTVFTVKVDTIQGATGPLVLTIEYVPEY